MARESGPMILFNDRQEAGEVLADKLRRLKSSLIDPIVLGIPRGGIPIGYYISEVLEAPMDALVLRKLPIPDNTEAGFGAVTLDKVAVFNKDLLSRLNLTKFQIDKIIDDVYEEVIRRNRVYRKNRPIPNFKGRSVILTDDGLASGFTMLAGIRFVRQRQAGEVIAAVPVAHREAYKLIKKECDRAIALHISAGHVFAVASFYRDFSDITDGEAVNYLENSIKENTREKG